MRMRSLILASAAAMALTSPSFASEAAGWYLGLGAGWDTMLLAHYNNLSTASPAIKLPYHDDVLGIGALGYKWGDSGFRTELELG
ncbi:MAG TPA: hypothetical protein VHE09_07820, partial [Rhizomicrobium sp.]|nr:hypothetical protein [Rhizomicrobium sp.]